MKEGRRTSEFWFAVVVGVLIAVLESLVSSGALPPGSRWAYLATAALAGLYAISRGMAKRGAFLIAESEEEDTK